MKPMNSMTRNGVLAAALAACFAATAALAAPPNDKAAAPKTAEEILKRADEQMTFATRSSTAVMRISDAEENRELELKLFARGEKDSFIVFLKPQRDKGNRILKLEGQLWSYFPRTEKTVKIAGHMLRQSIMGSDFSYEDMTENRSVLSRYNATLLADETMNGEPCYVIQLKEKEKGLSYPEVKQWVSKKYLLPLREERFGNNGKLLKVFEFKQITQFGNRNYPLTFSVQDKLKENSRTELILSDVKFGVDVPQTIFDVRNLEREVVY